jgi:hypothetical protein
LEKHDIRTRAQGSPARAVRYVFSATKYSHKLYRHGGNDVCKMFSSVEGYGPISSGTRVLELAADSRKVALWYGARWLPTTLLVYASLGGRLTATHDGGLSQPEERHNLAAEVLRIIRRRKTPVRGGFGKYSRTQHLLWRGDSIPVSDPPLP